MMCLRTPEPKPEPETDRCAPTYDDSNSNNNNNARPLYTWIIIFVMCPKIMCRPKRTSGHTLTVEHPNFIMNMAIGSGINHRNKNVVSQTMTTTTVRYRSLVGSSDLLGQDAGQYLDAWRHSMCHHTHTHTRIPPYLKVELKQRRRPSKRFIICVSSAKILKQTSGTRISKVLSISVRCLSHCHAKVLMQNHKTNSNIRMAKSFASHDSNWNSTADTVKHQQSPMNYYRFHTQISHERRLIRSSHTRTHVKLFTSWCMISPWTAKDETRPRYETSQ